MAKKKSNKKRATEKAKADIDAEMQAAKVYGQFFQLSPKADHVA